MDTSSRIVKLSEPVLQGTLSVESALLGRISVRNFRRDPLDLSEVSQLLWAAQGITRKGRYRTCPSAGALYPLELNLVAGGVNGLATGIYRYDPENHAIRQCSGNDPRRELAAAALSQSMIAHAPATIAISAVHERTTGKYGERGMRYVFMEAGHAAQNVHLQAVSLHLGTVVVGAFNDDKVKLVLGLQSEEIPLCLMPVGK
jgi:SagB-type dehydrogenase family enzyme